MPDPMRNPVRDTILLAEETVERDRAAQVAGTRLGMPSIFTCPDCGGTLWQVDEQEVMQFRCHVGHTLTGELLLAQQEGAAEAALWRAIRTLTDQTILARALAHYARGRGTESEAAFFEQQALASERRSQALRQTAESG